MMLCGMGRLFPIGTDIHPAAYSSIMAELLGSDFDSRVCRAAGGKNCCEPFEGDIRIYFNIPTRQCEGADAANGMTGKEQGSFGIEHSRFHPKFRLEQFVVDAGVSRSDDQKTALGGGEGKSLGNPRRLGL